jgi:hypothetical protein
METLTNVQNALDSLGGEEQAKQQTCVNVDKNSLARLATNAERLYFTHRSHKDRLVWWSLAQTARHLIVKNLGSETLVEAEVYNALVELPN